MSSDVPSLIGLIKPLGEKCRDARRASGFPMTASEDALEITCRVQTNAWLSLQLAHQYFRHPGGRLTLANVTALRVRMALSLMR